MTTKWDFVRDRVEQMVEVRGLAPGQSMRCDCLDPECGGVNSMSIVAGLDGSLSYICFRAGCDVSGRTRGSIRGVDLLRAKRKQHFEVVSEEPYEHPRYMVPVSSKYTSNERARAYLSKYDFLVQENLLWDVKENRIVFEVFDEGVGELVGAIGRTTDAWRTPKWRKYGSRSHPFILNPGHDVCVLVEDAVSAVRLAQDVDNVTVIALLGTAIPQSYIKYLTEYSLVIISLDKDALATAMKLMKDLGQYVPTVVRNLDSDDIKDMGPVAYKEYVENFNRYVRKKRKGMVEQ